MLGSRNQNCDTLHSNLIRITPLTCLPKSETAQQWIVDPKTIGFVLIGYVSFGTQSKKILRGNVEIYWTWIGIEFKLIKGINEF